MFATAPMEPCPYTKSYVLFFKAKSTVLYRITMDFRALIGELISQSANSILLESNHSTPRFTL